ncbi:glycosyltransferase 87 family protein [Jatrophihabitans fulvus]
MTDPRRAGAALFAVYAALYAVFLHLDWRRAELVLFVAAVPVFAALVLLLRRAPWTARTTLAVVFGGAVLLQVVALTAPPSTSDDVNRYIWDGRVQFDGIDPYSYPPQAPQLAHLRDPSLFPTGRTDCPWPIPDGCTVINRPSVRTVYPPAAQLVFDGTRAVTFGHGGVRAFQVLAVLGVLAVAGLLALLLTRTRRPVWPVAIWAWSPLAVLDYANNAHLDWAAALLGVGALAVSSRGRSASSGVLVALATLTKLYPALLIPSLLRRRPWVVIVAGLATGVLLYLPHVVAVGADVVGYLPGYLGEEGYDSGSRLLLLGLVLPHPLDTVVGGLLVAGTAVWALRRTDPDAPEQSAVVVLGVAFLVTTPGYSWYSGLLLALIVLARRYEWLPVAFAPGLAYLLGRGIPLATTGYALAGVSVAAVLLWRRRVGEPV